MSWVTVGIARLPCFGALCCVISAKVAQGELLRLCPGLPDEHLSRESRKLTGMMRRELVAIREVLKSLKKISALGEESVSPDLGVYSAPIRPSEF